MSDHQNFVLRLKPDITMELNKDPKDIPDRREEARTYPASTQYFAGVPYTSKEITITGTERRKHRLGIFIGPSPQFCDIVVPDSENSEHKSPAWGLITFDCKDRLVYRDVRHPEHEPGNTRTCNGSGVTMGSELGTDSTRRGFTWVLFGSSFLSSTHPDITIRLTDHIKLTAVVPDCGLYSPEHEARVQTFLEAPAVYEMGDPAAAAFEESLCVGQGLCLKRPGAATKVPIATHCRHIEQPEIILKKEVGSGSYGTVWRHYNVSTGKSTAVKKPTIPAESKNIQAEIALFEKIAKCAKKDSKSKDYSRYIVKFISGEMVPEPTLQLEYASHGTLEEQNGHRNLCILESSDALEQLLKAVSFLHRNDIAHRDIKPANVLVKYRTRKYRHRRDIGICLADLGLAKFKAHKTTGIGTFLYMAPELFQCDGPYTKAVDIWAMGVMFYDIFYALSSTIRAQRGTSEDAFRPVGLKMCTDIYEAIRESAGLGGRHALLAEFLHKYMVQEDAAKRLSADGCLAELGSLIKECGPDDEQTPVPSSPSLVPESHVAVHGSHARHLSSSGSASTHTMTASGGPVSVSDAVAHAGCGCRTCNSLSRGSSSSSISMPRTIPGSLSQTARNSGPYAPVLADVDEDSDIRSHTARSSGPYAPVLPNVSEDEDYVMAETGDSLGTVEHDGFVLVKGNAEI